MKDAKTAASRLDSDMDAYWAAKGKAAPAAEAEAKVDEEAPAAALAAAQ
jgi:hypothetical protein